MKSLLDNSMLLTEISKMFRWFAYVAYVNRRYRSSKIVALTPGPWIERPTFPGLVTESPLTPGRYEVLDKQLARAHKDAFYTLEPRRYYVHHSRVYPRDVCTSSYASNDEKKRGRNRGGEEEEARKRDKRVRDEARKASSRSMKRDNAYIDMPSVRQRFASSLPSFSSHKPASYSLSPSRTTLRRIPHDDKSLDTTATCLTNENHVDCIDCSSCHQIEDITIQRYKWIRFSFNIPMEITQDGAFLNILISKTTNC